MNLTLFPLKHENPFLLKVETGKPLIIDKNRMILCSGMGTAGVNSLGKVLFEYPEIKSVVEFGSAASVAKATVGTIYECTTFCSFDGSVLGTTVKQTELPNAAVMGSNELYEGEKYDWAELFDIPVLYTMETLMFRAIAHEFKKQFLSIRLATDVGSGDIREQIKKALDKAKSKVSAFFTS